jgi:hypothetical protein
MKKSTQDNLGSPEAIAAGVAAATLAMSAIEKIVAGINDNFKIGATMVNNSRYTLEKMDGTGSLHHGKTYTPPEAFISPLAVDTATFDNHTEWAIQQSGARSSEGIMVYRSKELELYFCFYLKHGHNFEAGLLLLTNAQWKEKNAQWKYPTNNNRTGEDIIHYLQTFFPKGKNQHDFGRYCTKDTSATVSVGDIRVHFQAAESVEFNISEIGYSEPSSIVDADTPSEELV